MEFLGFAKVMSRNVRQSLLTIRLASLGIVLRFVRNQSYALAEIVDGITVVSQFEVSHAPRVVNLRHAVLVRTFSLDS